MKKYTKHLFLLLFTLLSTFASAQLYVDGTIVTVDSAEFAVEGMRYQIGTGSGNSYGLIEGGDQTLAIIDSLVVHDTLFSDGKVIIDEAYRGVGGLAAFVNGDSIIVNGDWINSEGSFTGDGVVSFQSTADTQIIHNDFSLDNGFWHAEIEGGGLKLVKGNFNIKNLYLRDGIIEREGASDTVALGFGPSVDVVGNQSYIRGEFYVQDTGTIVIPTGDNEGFRPAVITGVRTPAGFNAASQAPDDIPSTEWEKLPLLRVNTGVYTGSGQDAGMQYTVFAQRFWEIDTIFGSIDSAQVQLFYDPTDDLPGGASFSSSDLVTMTSDGILASSNYDTVGLSNSGSTAAFGGLDFITSNLLLPTKTFDGYYFVGLRTLSCDVLNAMVALQNTSAIRCDGQTVVLTIDTTGTNSSSIFLNQAVWQDSTVSTALTYDATGSGNYRAIITYNNSCRDTTDYFPLSFNPNPQVSFVDNGSTVVNQRNVSLLANGLGGSTGLFDLTELQNGELILTDSNSTNLILVNNALAVGSISFTVPFTKPTGIASKGNFAFIADKGAEVVRVVNRNGAAGTAPLFAGTASDNFTETSSRSGNDRYSDIFASPIDVAIDSSGLVYVADDSLNVVRIVSRDYYTTIGKMPSDVRTDGLFYHDFSNIKSIAVNNQNKILIADGDSLIVGNLSDSTFVARGVGDFTKVDPAIGAFNFTNVRSVHATPDGRFAFSVSDRHNVVIYNTITDSLELAGGTSGTAGTSNGLASSAQFNDPSGVLFSQRRNGLLVLDQDNNQIRKIADTTIVTFCAGLSADLITDVSGTGTGSYLWSTSETTNNITVNLENTYSVTYTAPVTMCATTESVFVDVLEDAITDINIYNAGMGLDTFFCNSTVLNITTNAVALGMDSIIWLNEDQDTVGIGTYVDNPNFQITSSVTDSIFYLELHEGVCIDTIPINFKAVSPPYIDTVTISSSVVCSDDSLDLVASIPDSAINPVSAVYTWTLLNTSTTFPAVNNDSTFSYGIQDSDIGSKLLFQLAYDNSCGAAAIDSTDSIPVIGIPNVNIYKDPPGSLITTVDEFFIQDSTILTLGDSAYTFRWDFSGEVYEADFPRGLNFTESFTYQPNTSYSDLKYPSSDSVEFITLTVTDTAGCSSVDSLRLEVVDYKILYIPNAFAPEDALDDENRSFKCYGVNISNNDFSITVYNRWGEVVYETTDYYQATEIGWNGLAKNTGAALESGVYTYILKGRFVDGLDFSRTGSVTLIR